MSTRSLPITFGSLALLTLGLSVAGCAENQPGGASQGEATGGLANSAGGTDSGKSSTTKAAGKGGSSTKTTTSAKGGRAATSSAAEEGGSDGNPDSTEGGSASSSEPDDAGGTSPGGSSARSSRTRATGGSSSVTSAPSSGGASSTKATSSNATTGGSTSGGSAEKFSFFVISYKSIIELSGTDKGFGGDLRYGETGDGAGLRGADKICAKVAETSMPNNGKVWRAFLSTSKEDAIDRVGEGPWYDRRGRVFAMTKADLLYTRPKGADSAIVNDLPNENGTPNHDPDGTGNVDNHDFLTGSGIDGKLYTKTADPTCADWTNSTADNARDKRPRVGHSWPRAGFGSWTGGPGMPGTGAGGSTSVAAGNVEGMEHWISALDESGCGPGVNQPAVGEFDGPPGSDGAVGSGGGYGGWYCFALTP